MRVDRRVWAIVALVVAIGVAFWLRGPSTGDSPEHRTDSDAANGTSALPRLASALGRQTTTLDGSFRLSPGLVELFVFTPTRGFGPGDAARLSGWVRGGGVLVYAAETGDPGLDFSLGVRRGQLPVSGDATGTGPMLAGVARVSGGDAVRPLLLGASDVGLLRSAGGAAVGYEQLVGRGRLIVLADPLPLCNGYLEEDDNGRLASDLISLAPVDGQVAFDEYHHAQPGTVGGSPLTGLLSTSWGAGISWAVVAMFVGLLLRGRAFGPRVRLFRTGDRSSAEHVAAVGRLLERTRAAGMTGQLLATATRRSLAVRHGLREAGPALDSALAVRAPAEAAELAQAEAELRANPGEGGLVAAAARLHGLAYPSVDKEGSFPPTPTLPRQGGGRHEESRS